MDGLPTLSEKISRGETLRIIDESIAKQQKVIDELLAPLLALKSRRNDFLPISCLPPEIICKIFLLSQIPYPTAYKTNPLKWINLTYVCRHWRFIALHLPSLWVALPIGNRKWVEEMLRRSKESGLIIKFNTDRNSGMVQALQQIHRFRELSLRLIEWNSLREMFPISVPRLECLSLDGQFKGFRPGGPGPFVIPDFLCEAERLRELVLKNCRLNWNLRPRFLHSLTHLTLDDAYAKNFSATGRQFANALKNMPELEVLSLCHSLPLQQLGQQSSWGSEYIHLAHLHTLVVQSAFIEVENFLGCVTFPPTARVDLICYNDGIHLNFSGAIFALARSYSNTTPDTTFHRLTQYQNSDEGFLLMLYTENTIPHLNLTLYCTYSGLPAIRKLMTDIFCSGIPLHDVNYVHLPDNLHWLDAETMANTFGRLPRLRSVMASGTGARSFFDALHLGSHVGDTARSGETPIQELYFPCISSIGLRGMTFVEADMLDNPAYSDILTIELLQNSLIRRCELGLPIETLILRDCPGVFDEDIKSFEEIVDNVDWDKYEYILNENSEGEEGEEGEGESEEDDE